MDLCRSMIVSQAFFSVPLVHQYLLTISPWRCQFALASILLQLWQTLWMSWIFLVMELAISSAWVCLSLSLWLTSFRILSLLLVRFFILEFIFPASIFLRHLANMVISWISFWSCFFGFFSCPFYPVY